MWEKVKIIDLLETTAALGFNVGKSNQINTVIDLFSALCAKLFQRGRQIFEVFFFF